MQKQGKSSGKEQKICLSLEWSMKVLCDCIVHLGWVVLHVWVTWVANIPLLWRTDVTFVTWANHITSLFLRFSLQVKQELSSPSEELGELIKTSSGLRLMPIVQGIVKILSGAQFTHPSRRWMTANCGRCRGELLVGALEKITDERMVFLGRRGKKSSSCYVLARKEIWGRWVMLNI